LRHLPNNIAAILERLAILFRGTRLAQRHIDRRHQARERRAQFVRNIRGGLFLAVECLLQHRQ